MSAFTKDEDSLNEDNELKLKIVPLIKKEPLIY